MSKKTPPHPECPQWTTARVNQFIRTALRGAWVRWPPRSEALKLAKERDPDNPRGFKWRCARCDKLFPAKQVNADHIIPCGTSLKGWDRFIERMFIGVDKIQVLCRSCHKEKTKEEKENG